MRSYLNNEALPRVRTRPANLGWALASALLLGVLIRADGAFLIVDSNHAGSADDNPGTLDAPFKTVQAGLDKAQAGDTVQVRGGVYHEAVTFRRGGSYPGGAIETWSPQNLKWLTLEAYQDEHVVLDGAVTIPDDEWELVNGRTNTYVAPFSSERQVNMVFRDGVMLLPTLGNVAGANSSKIEGAPSSIMPVMPDDAPTEEGYYYDLAQQKLFVNLGGRVPGKDAEVRAARLLTGIDACNKSFVRVRKFEVRNFIATGIGVYNDQEFVAEDNYVHHCGQGFWGGPSGVGVIRRNTVSDIMTVAMGLGGARGTIVEENVIKRTHINPYKIVAYDGAAVVCNGAFGFVLRNNIITDSDISGVWPDVSSLGIACYGNTIYNLTGCAYYIEASVYGTILRWNTMFDNAEGIAFRQNWANTAFENYIFRNRRTGLSIGSCDQDGLPKASTMVYNWVIDNGIGSSFGPDLLGEPAHSFDHNVYKVPDGGVILQFGSKQYKDLPTLRSELGLEMHGSVVTNFDPTPLGLVTFRVHDTKNSWEPVPMFGNPNTERNDVLHADETTPYFWKKGTFRGVEEFNWGTVDVGYVCSTRDDRSGFVRQLRVPGKYAEPAKWARWGLNDKTAARPGNVTCLQVGSVEDKTISAQGFGFWGTCLPTTDGAEIDLSLWVRARNVKAAAENGGLYVTVEFTDETGQNASRQYLVSAEEGEEAAGAEWITGDYLYRQLTGMVTAPQGARWFKLGFGLRNCTGWVAFNDLDIHTRPGTPEAQEQRVLPIDAQAFAWTPCDLTGLLNRPLADDVDNDGKGGWTDQGPMMDLRNLGAGEYTWNDVTFRVAQGNACFIMKNSRRPSENLPDGGKLTLDAKTDVLAFLHTGGWLDADTRHATYVIHYTDGTRVEIPIVCGKNIFDWVSPAEWAAEVKYDPAMGLILPATSVASPQFVHVTVWMLLWENPNPEKKIQALEVIGANAGIPGLMAVSLGIAK